MEEGDVDVGESCDVVASSSLDVVLAFPFPSHPFDDEVEAAVAVASEAALDDVAVDEELEAVRIQMMNDGLRAFELKEK